eukprot:CAMPEP_0184559678 /NCGR_PEP_ID=MMETSP0199_2-20130426/46549_1 /TAXON_ID=1112570 /ORGANISM="Thraustochytrium sp., Strain LLF1b" /LENGTH=2117 /DNA_ID=CAMNT_0026956973 /DNA_START=107 /DNA_END=6456 /DNA_ORIENTATION=-
MGDNERVRGFSALPKDQGLYLAENERDNCGVGFIANFKSRASSKLVQDALVMLGNMDHRGGCGCEVNSGDGAGIMIGTPYDYFRKAAKKELGVELRANGEWAVGNVFLSHDEAKRNQWKAIIEAQVKARNIRFVGWRKAPTDNSTIGRSALKTEPYVEQLFVENVQGWEPSKFDLMLYVVCQSVRREAIKAAENDLVYFCSLSSQTMVFKGQLTSAQVREYYCDLQNPELLSHFALVHSRFSTNTFPSWDRAHPNRVICHNGEINTLRGNKNQMSAREGQLRSPLLPNPTDTGLLMPVCSDDYSDSGNFDAVLELLSKASNRSLPECVMMMLPEAWQNDPLLSKEKRAFYEYNSCLMEPWDGPAMIAFADGRYLGCILDRNGLRPHRYYVTDDTVVAASEVGVIPHLPEDLVVDKGRLQPGKMFLVDFERQGIVGDYELKHQIASSLPYDKWVKDNLMRLTELSRQYPRRAFAPRHDIQIEEEAGETAASQLNNMLNMFGYSVETLDMLLPPMVNGKKEALGSMGVDTPLACLSAETRSIYDYFKQLFAQVTNPPMDSIREEVVMAMKCPIGPMQNILEVIPENAARLEVDNPILRPREAECILRLRQHNWKTLTINTTYPRGQGLGALDMALKRICQQASSDISERGATCLFLTDRSAGPDDIPIPSLIALGAVHQHLLRTKERTRVALVLEAGDAREVHHFCCLIGFGADAIYPYIAFESISHLYRQKKIVNAKTVDECLDTYVAACGKGIRKVMGKIGISTVQSYKGAQIFEAVGVGAELMARCFAGTASRIGGITLETIERDSAIMHERAWPRAVPDALPTATLLHNAGEFHFRNGGESHFNDPKTIVGIQETGRNGDREKYFAFAEHANEQASKCTLRGLLDFRETPKPLSLDDVEPAKEIVKRFVSGAMSFGSISKEAHETLAIAMNQLGGKSNTGEGGEDPERFTYLGPNGERKRSAIKQVASGRFGVTSEYLANSDEIQIKMAQGAKPGEGGELPGKKVFGQIAKIRKSTEGVGLISPPPHHDIYSIEDLAQLIHDLKNANPRARISVKLVSEVGVGVIAAGVAKAKADHIVVSGHDGGTGAAAWTGIKHCGLPWELGLAETQQTLVLNNLRSRVVLQTDGQMKTGRDVAVAFLLGAEEVAFATAPLIALGCIMMRKCHLNTCPVGIATQDPELRKKFFGKPEYVVNYLFMVAEEVRTYMAKMGFRSVNEMIGRSDMLQPKKNVAQLNPKLGLLDLSKILLPSAEIARASPLSLVLPEEPVHMINAQSQDHGLENALDMKLIRLSRNALEQMRPVAIEEDVFNINRTVGTMLSFEVSKRYGSSGLPANTINIKLNGSAGQSCGAFLAPGISIEVCGDTNDYFGKGLSGGTVTVYPKTAFKGVAEDNMVTGNVCFYGATAGRGFVRGVAGERFCVRNSGAIVVVEGVGDHGLEYMTGGRVTILGETGKNFGAGMSGGIAYIYDKENVFESRANMELIALEDLNDVDMYTLRNDLQEHLERTGSEVAKQVLDNFSASLKHFVKVYPKDLRTIIEGKKSDPSFVLPAWFPQLPSVTGAMEEAASDVASVSSGGSTEASSSSGWSSARSIEPSNTHAFVDIEDVGAKGCAPTASKKISKNNTLSTRSSGTPPSVTAYEQFVERRNGSKGPLNKLRGFIEYERNPEPYRNPSARLNDWKEINNDPSARPELERKTQAARCMDCGTPFCQTHDGCPINNLIPEFNDLVYRDQWKEALDRLLLTNNFPEFTGRVCPAPCEGSCVAGLIDKPVTIKNIEYAIIDRGFKEGWIVPNPPSFRSNKTVAIIGSGPAGLAAADQLNQEGHSVTVYERADRIGGLLMYGIPNMKLDKSTVQRRVDLMAAEGVTFVPNANVGVDPQYNLGDMRKNFDSLVLTVGATKPRDLPAKGRELNGIHFAMDFLTKNTAALLVDGEGRLKKHDGTYITARGKNVVVIGGGDTGADCIGTSLRHGCSSVTNFELLDKPPAERDVSTPWPEWPRMLRTDYAHEEAIAKFGGDPRTYCILTKEFIGDEEGNVCGIKTVLVRWEKKDPKSRPQLVELEGTEKIVPADLVLLSMGFLGPEPEIVKQLPLKVDERSNIKAAHGDFRTNLEGVYAA